MDYQEMVIVGNATKDAEVNQSPCKTTYADFALGVSRTQDETTIFPTMVFGKLAETCENIKKRVKALVEGRVDISEHNDKQGQ